MSRLLVSLAAALTLSGQSAVRLDQVRAAPATVVRVLGADANGRIVLLELGPGVAIVGNRITAAAPPAVDVVQAVERLVPDGAGAFVARPGATYSRNGLRLIEGIDYTITGAVFRPIWPWTDDDLFAAHLITIKPRP